MRIPAAMIVLATASPVAAQVNPWPAPSLRIVDSMRLEQSQVGLNTINFIALRGNGTAAVLGTTNGPSLAYLDSAGRRKWIRQLWPDVRYPAGVSWMGDSLYVFDNATDQALAVGVNGGVGAIFDFPDYVRPKWKDRKAMPAYGAIDVVATLDTFLIGTPRRPHTLGMYGTSTKPDPTRMQVVKVNHDGIVETILGTIINRSDVWSVLSDGRLVVFRTQRDSIAFVGISPRGDTTFSRMLIKPRVVFSATGGPDGTFWVSSSMGGKEFYYTLFDAKGVALGRLALPDHLRIMAGDAKHLWMIETKGQKKPIIRYTISAGK